VINLGFVKLSQRQLLALMAFGCISLLVFGLYLQHLVGLEPCPMCIVQRYVMVLIVLWAGLFAAIPKPWAATVGLIGAVLMGLGGAGVAARQSWMQWYPPQVQTCALDFYDMVETLPLKRALPMIFRGGGDCTKIDWTFLGGSIANWSFVAFCAIVVAALWALWCSHKNTA
jgi:protein dithiol:quinone oxidoreductase